MFLGHLEDQKAIDRFFYLCKQLFPDVKVIEEDGSIHAEETMAHQKQGLRYLFTGFNFGYNLNYRINPLTEEIDYTAEESLADAIARRTLLKN